MQLAITVAIVACTMLIGCTTYDEGTMYHCPAVFYMNTHVWFFWTFLALTIVTMCVLFCVRRRHPVNLIMLFLFVSPPFLCIFDLAHSLSYKDDI